jgi:hypothetical protein
LDAMIAVKGCGGFRFEVNHQFGSGFAGLGVIA